MQASVNIYTGEDNPKGQWLSISVSQEAHTSPCSPGKVAVIQLEKLGQQVETGYS